jgi:hypothetical protein
MPPYPEWFYYPTSKRPPDWVHDFIEAISNSRGDIESAVVGGLTSDRVLASLRPSLAALGFAIESSKKQSDKIRRPVLFGANGHERVAYEVDGYHEQFGIVLEVEAGRGARGNAVYRDLIRTSLIADARYLALGVMLSYRHQSMGKEMSVASFTDAAGVLDAIYASGRLHLPFEGVLLFGY